ncbi:MAG TPA: PAS domain-containing sensor histidine kinase [Candidatus Limnocylindrales bacterium]|nr:PAS domain-containing sensor histidine kinase [Candidatus Limnocylindrales bacterium]
MPIDQEPDPTPPSETATQPPPGEAFRLLVEAVQDYAIFLLGPDGHVRTWNPGAERAKGYAASEIIGQHFSAFYTPEEREAGRPQWLLGRAAAEGRVEDEGWRVRKDGTRFWADVILTALRDANGALYGFAKITRDLTERKRAEEQQRDLIVEQRARAAAEQALMVRDRFLSVASHELKTPVATLQLSAESLLRARELGRLDDARLETGLHRILKSTGRLGALVSELLDVSLLSVERDRPVRQPTDIVALVQEVTARFADVVENESRVAVQAPERAVVMADASRLDQVFTNLIDNALKYSPPGEPIEVRVADEPDSVTVTVADRGIGLDAATQARLFEAFSRGDNATHVPGLGLGLFITHQIVERHGGRIEAQPAPGGVGSVFRVSLPKDAM